MAKRLPEAEFLRIGRECGWRADDIQRVTGISLSMVHKRVRYLKDKRHDITRPRDAPVENINNRYPLEISDGCVVIGSDAHYWPEIVTTAHRAFVKFVRHLKPAAVILNGDVFDGARISRHDPDGWESTPTVKQELETVQDRLAEIEKVSANAKLIRTRGNHDQRFEKRLASMAPEYQGIPGTVLSDHIPRWAVCRSVWINELECVVTHRWANGIHAVYNNTLRSGVSYVTGHLHSLKVTPWTDLRGDRYGVDTGTLADINDPAFAYAEDSPRNWRSGFVVLTFVGGKLMPPELVQKVGDGRVYFRGKVWDC
jgi:predicted phosphodiesterase